MTTLCLLGCMMLNSYMCVCEWKQKPGRSVYLCFEGDLEDFVRDRVRFRIREVICENDENPFAIGMMGTR